MSTIKGTFLRSLSNSVFANSLWREQMGLCSTYPWLSYPIRKAEKKNITFSASVL
jgi:hypothetical protein